MNEFELIARYFTRPSHERQAVGDDCALIDVGDRTLAITCDMLIEQRHFFSSVDPAALGHKSLAVNLSDLAAAGARPRCFFLALALPYIDENWLARFSAGLFALADAHGCALIGGDTTRTPRWQQTAGPLTICITAIGEIEGTSLSRAGARAGDEVWVSGALGDAACALEAVAGKVSVDDEDRETFQRRLDWPTPRLELGRALRGIASAAMDVSDGLIGDLAHIGERSGVAARLRWEDIPRSAALRRQPLEVQQRCALAGGDDYELLFCAAPERRAQVEAAAVMVDVQVSRIGTIEEGSGVFVLGRNGADIGAKLNSYDHFRA
jgi:thiamine-monophosphate kinase